MMLVCSPTCALLHLLEGAAIERLFLPSADVGRLAQAAVEMNIIPSRLRELIVPDQPVQITPHIASLLRRLPDCTFRTEPGAIAAALGAPAIDEPPRPAGGLRLTGPTKR